MSPVDPAGDCQIIQCIMPTRTCFDDALDLLVELLTVEHVPPEQLRLVHAICLVPDEGTRFAHAWVERHGREGSKERGSKGGKGGSPLSSLTPLLPHSLPTTCLFLGLYQGTSVLCSVERRAYYAHLRVQARTKYTPWQADRENARTLTYGPWHPQYQALCTPREGHNAR